jgi:CheY-like chemotaxis protein
MPGPVYLLIWEAIAFLRDKFFMQQCVLIYEDDPEILELCKTVLNTFGYRVIAKTRCEHIIRDVAECQPDAVLMDLWIPQIGGERAITLLREDPTTRDTRVILFSANDEIGNISRRVKANAYLKKPFDVNCLKRILEEVLSGAA